MPSNEASAILPLPSQRRSLGLSSLNRICINILTILTIFFLVFNRFVQPTVPNGEGASGFQEYQIQFVKNLIDDSLDEFRYGVSAKVVAVVSVCRQPIKLLPCSQIRLLENELNQE
jgi:hypothetical protein